MVMETPSPQCVGREFVRQYYTLLHEAPLHLHRFYSHNSCFVHGGVEKPGEEQPPVTGQSDIHKKICTLDFRDCHAKIRQVDSQATVGNAVVVQVTGELSNNGQPMRRFMQTFVLVPQLPKKYYVHNDIFRYQDEVFHDNDTDTENLDDVVDSETETQESITNNDAVLTPTTGYYEQAPQTISNGNVHAEEVIKPTQPIAIPEPEIEREKTPEPEQAPEEEPEPVKEPVYEAKEQEKQPEEETEVEPQGPPKPVTWAAIARDKNQNNNVAPAPAPAPAKAPVVPQPKPAEVKSEPGQAPQPQRTARPNRERAAVPRERDGSRPGMEMDETRRSRHPDSHQVFVGNLPHNTPDDDLKTFFSRYGKVVEMRINKKAGQTSVPNFGFVVFDDEKAVQEVLNHRRNLQLPDGHRLNVEEKKQRGEGGRPGSGTRLGRGGMGPGRGMHSGPSRGGGRGMGPMINRSDNRGRGGGGFSGPRR